MKKKTTITGILLVVLMLVIFSNFSAVNRANSFMPTPGEPTDPGNGDTPGICDITTGFSDDNNLKNQDICSITSQKEILNNYLTNNHFL